MSNAIIRQEGLGPVVADNVWQLRLGSAPFLLGVAAGAGLVLRLARRPPGTAPTPTDWPVTIAHRGGAGIAPENTMEAFRRAAELGDVVLELDARTASGGEVVVIHDDTVDRTADGTGPVAHKSLTRLQRLDAGYRCTAGAGDGEAAPWRGRGIRIPALEEVYREFPDHKVVIELKGDRPGTEQAVWRAIETAGAQGRTLVATNGTASIRRFRQVSGGKVATAASTGEFAVFWALGLLRLHRLYHPRFQALQPPETFKGLRVVTPAFVRRAHRAGLRVDVWTVNEEADMDRLLNWGVDGIMTDRPDVLAGILKGGDEP